MKQEKDSSFIKKILISLVFPILIPLIFFIIQYIIQFEEKSLSYEIIAQSKIIDLNSSDLINLKVAYKKEAISTLTSVHFHIINSGNIPISRQDFDKKLGINFGKGTKILLAQVSDTLPKNLKPIVSFKSNELNIKPLLLNPKDRFTVNAYISGEYKSIKFDVRIKGIPDIKEIIEPKKKRVISIKLIIFAGIAGFFALAIYGYLGGIIVSTFLYSSAPFRNEFALSKFRFGLTFFSSGLSGIVALAIINIEVGDIKKIALIAFITVLLSVLTGSYNYKNKI